MTFVVEDGEVKVVNSAVYVLMSFQQQKKDKGEKANLFTDEDVAVRITTSRREKSAK